MVDRALFTALRAVSIVPRAMLAEEAELISASPESLRLTLDVATVTLSIKSFAPAACPPVASQLPDTNTKRYSPAAATV